MQNYQLNASPFITGCFIARGFVLQVCENLVQWRPAVCIPALYTLYALVYRDAMPMIYTEAEGMILTTCTIPPGGVGFSQKIEGIYSSAVRSVRGGIFRALIVALVSIYLYRAQRRGLGLLFPSSWQHTRTKTESRNHFGKKKKGQGMALQAASCKLQKQKYAHSRQAPNTSIHSADSK